MNEDAPLCVDCAHHRIGWFGRHMCHGFVSLDVVTGKRKTISDTCSSMRHSHYFPGVGFVRGASAQCGPEGRLFEGIVNSEQEAYMQFYAAWR